MKITITIKTGNAATTESEDIVALFREYAARITELIRRGNTPAAAAIFDINGNQAGKFTVTK